ncbi:MAG: hypothetical protein WCA46_11435 [Actinocatenispora sp.]
MANRRTMHGPPPPPGADDMTLLGGGRIWEQNIRPLLEMLALYAGGGFDSTEWSVTEQRLKDTDAASADGWYNRPVYGGVARLAVVMARVSGDDLVSVRIWGNDVPGLAERVDTLFDIGTLYRLTAS